MVHKNAAYSFILVSKMALNVMWMLIWPEIGIRRTQMIELVSSPVPGTLSSMQIVLSSGVPKCSRLWPSVQRLNLLRYHLHYAKSFTYNISYRNFIRIRFQYLLQSPKYTAEHLKTMLPALKWLQLTPKFICAPNILWFDCFTSGSMWKSFISIEHVPSQEQTANIFTKSLPHDQFHHLHHSIMGWASNPVTAYEGV